MKEHFKFGVNLTPKDGYKLLYGIKDTPIALVTDKVSDDISKVCTKLPVGPLVKVFIKELNISKDFIESLYKTVKEFGLAPNFVLILVDALNLLEESVPLTEKNIEKVLNSYYDVFDSAYVRLLEINGNAQFSNDDKQAVKYRNSYYERSVEKEDETINLDDSLDYTYDADIDGENDDFLNEESEDKLFGNTDNEGIKNELGDSSSDNDDTLDNEDEISFSDDEIFGGSESVDLDDKIDIDEDELFSSENKSEDLPIIQSDSPKDDFVLDDNSFGLDGLANDEVAVSISDDFRVEDEFSLTEEEPTKSNESDDLDNELEFNSEIPDDELIFGDELSDDEEESKEDTPSLDNDEIQADQDEDILEDNTIFEEDIKPLPILDDKYEDYDFDLGEDRFVAQPMETLARTVIPTEDEEEFITSPEDLDVLNMHDDENPNENPLTDVSKETSPLDELAKEFGITDEEDEAEEEEILLEEIPEDTDLFEDDNEEEESVETSEKEESVKPFEHKEEKVIEEPVEVKELEDIKVNPSLTETAEKIQVSNSNDFAHVIDNDENQSHLNTLDELEPSETETTKEAIMSAEKEKEYKRTIEIMREQNHELTKELSMLQKQFSDINKRLQRVESYNYTEPFSNEIDIKQMNEAIKKVDEGYKKGVINKSINHDNDEVGYIYKPYILEEKENNKGVSNDAIRELDKVEEERLRIVRSVLNSRGE